MQMGGVLLGYVQVWKGTYGMLLVKMSMSLPTNLYRYVLYLFAYLLSLVVIDRWMCDCMNRIGC